MELAEDRRIRQGSLLLLCLLLTFAASKAILYDTLDPDLFWHLRVAEQLRAEGIGPVLDHLSFMSLKTPWTPYSWLAELAMSAIWRWGGFRAAIAVQSLMITSIFAITAWASWIRTSAGERTNRLGVVIVTLFAGYLAMPYLSFRPVTACLVLFAAAVWLIVRDRQKGEKTRAVWLIVPLTIVAVNVHIFATVIPLSAAALLAGAIVERRNIRRCAVLLVLTSAAICATPMLPGMIHTMWFYQAGGSMVASSGIAELAPFYAGGLGWLSVAIVVSGLVVCWTGRDRLRAGDWFWMIGGLILLLRMGRFSPVFVIIAAPIVAAALPDMRGAMLGRPAIRLALALLLCVGVVRIIAGFPARGASIDAWLNRMGPDTPGYPCGAAAFVDRAVMPATGRILNEFSWGGYLDWRLGSKFQTLIDGRTQCFPPAVWHDATVGSPAQMLALLQPIAGDAAIVPRDRGTLRAALAAMKWKRVFADDRAEVFVPPRSELAAIND
jgi:hypothetical protein